MPKVAETLVGDEWKAGTAVRSELQDATLPSGERQRRFRVGTRPLATEGMHVLLVLARDRRGFAVEDLVAADPAVDKGDEAESFARRAGDLVAVARRVHALRQALAAAQTLAEKAADMPVAARAAKISELRAVLDETVTLREPTHETWVRTHCEPHERALKAKLEALDKAK